MGGCIDVNGLGKEGRGTRKGRREGQSVGVSLCYVWYDRCGGLIVCYDLIPFFFGENE